MASSYEGNSQNQGPHTSFPSVDLSASDLSEMPAASTHAPGFVFVEQGVKLDCINLIRSGLVNLIVMNEDGYETILGLRSRGWWMGASAWIAGVPSPITIKALTECSVSKVSTEDFRARLAKDPGLREHFLATQSREVLMMHQHAIIQSAIESERRRFFEARQTSSNGGLLNGYSNRSGLQVSNLSPVSPGFLSRNRTQSEEEQ